MYNVAYDNNITGDTTIYCIDWMSFRVAEIMLFRFTEKFVGKPFPNGKGWYPYTNARIVEQSQ